MSNNSYNFGLDAELAAKAAAKYSAPDEATARAYIQKMTGVSIAAGPDNLHAALKDGSVLCQMANSIKPGCAGKGKTEKMAFKQMENISQFLKGAASIGVLTNELFQTVDLFEQGNMGQVVLCIMSLERRAGGKGALKSSAAKEIKTDHSVIGLQMGTNKGANQGGMTGYGTGRQIGGADISKARTSGPVVVKAAAAAPKAAPSSGGGGAVPKFCGECGAKNTGAKFCGECGKKF
jgi:hypothetical protein